MLLIELQEPHKPMVMFESVAAYPTLSTFEDAFVSMCLACFGDLCACVCSPFVACICLCTCVCAID